MDASVKLNANQEVEELMVGKESATFVSSDQIDNPAGSLQIVSTSSQFCCKWQVKNGQLVYTCVPGPCPNQ